MSTPNLKNHKLYDLLSSNLEEGFVYLLMSSVLLPLLVNSEVFLG